MPNLHERQQIEYSYRREINELYISVTIKHIALGLVAVFEPIYIYLHFGGSILPTLLYFGVIYIGFGLLTPLAGYVVSKIGIKRSILISIPFIIVYFIGLRSLGDVSWLIYVLPLLNIIYKTFYWTAFNLDFTLITDSKKRGHQVGVLRMTRLAAKILSPFIGGVIIVFSGYSNLFLVAIIILGLSVIPLFFSKEVYTRHPYSIRDLLNFTFKQKNLWRNRTALTAWGAENYASIIVWPIMIYLIIVDYSVIGGIMSSTTIIAFLFAFVIGKFVDRWGTKKVFHIGAIANAIAWTIRSIVGSPAQVAIADGSYKLAQEATNIGFNTEIYSQAARGQAGALTYIVFRELMLTTGRVLLIITCAGLFALTGALEPTLWVVALASLLLIVL